jgi:hypothetical protein
MLVAPKSMRRTFEGENREVLEDVKPYAWLVAHIRDCSESHGLWTVLPDLIADTRASRPVEHWGR